MVSPLPRRLGKRPWSHGPGECIAQQAGDRQGVLHQCMAGQEPAHPSGERGLTVREADLSVVFRVVEQGRWPVLLGTDFHLHVTRYNDMVIDQSVRPASRRDPAFLTYVFLDRIESLDFHSSHLKLGKLQRGEFGGSAVGALGLKDYLAKEVRLPTEEYPDTLSNSILVSALLNLEMVLAVYYARAFEGVNWMPSGGKSPDGLGSFGIP